MQISGNTAAFVVLQGKNSTTQTSGCVFGLLASGYVGVDFQPARGFSIMIAQRRPPARHHNPSAVALVMAKFPRPSVCSFNHVKWHWKLGAKQFMGRTTDRLGG